MKCDLYITNKVTWFNKKKPQGPNFYLRIADESEKTTHFCSGSWLVMRSGLFTATSVENGRCRRGVSQHKQSNRMLLLCVWWDCQKINHYDLLLHGKTHKSELYCQQLDRLKKAFAQMRLALINGRGIVFHQDNARKPTSIVTRQMLRELVWEVLMHPSYNLYLSLSYYHLFLDMANDLTGK